MNRKENARLQAGDKKIHSPKECGESIAQAATGDPRLPPGTCFCKCPTCGEYFGGVSGFDRHRVSGKCVNPELVGLLRNAKDYWVKVGPKHPVSRAGVARLEEFTRKQYPSEGKRENAPEMPHPKRHRRA